MIRQRPLRKTRKVKMFSRMNINPLNRHVLDDYEVDCYLNTLCKFELEDVMPEEDED